MPFFPFREGHVVSKSLDRFGAWGKTRCQRRWFKPTLLVTKWRRISGNFGGGVEVFGAAM